MAARLNPPPPPRRIAVRMTNWLGDCVMNTPFLAGLRVLFPQARIVALARANVAGVLDGQPDIDEVWAIDDRSRRGYIDAVRRLRGWRADLGFALPNSINSAAMLAFGGVRHRVGYARDARRFLLTHPVKLRPEDLGIHEVRYYWRLLSLWKQSREIAVPGLRLAVRDHERDAMSEWLGSRGIGESEPLIGVNPAAFYGTAKRWPAKRFAAAAKVLARELDARVIVTGLPAERDVAQQVCDAGGSAFHNSAGEMNLRELMAFLDRARLFLTNDSGAMHVAAALKCPLVAVFGSTDWVTTAPMTDLARIVRVETPCAPCLLRHCPIDHRCMTAVTPEMALEAARELLSVSAESRSRT